MNTSNIISINPAKTPIATIKSKNDIQQSRKSPGLKHKILHQLCRSLHPLRHLHTVISKYSHSTFSKCHFYTYTNKIYHPKHFFYKYSKNHSKKLHI